MPYLYYAAILYVAATGIFLVAENRRPTSTFAWMLLFVAVPVGGLVIYVLFGRNRKAFSRRRKLIQQDRPGHLADTLADVDRQHEAAVAVLERAGSPWVGLVQLLRSNAHSQVTLGNRAEVLQDAIEAYPRLVADIRAAKSSIHMQYYIWASDEFGAELRRLLLEKVAEGVEVRVLYDPVGSFFRLSPFYVRAMRRGGVRMRPFSQLWRLHTISYRNHRKITVIDGCIGHTGGLNIGKEHLIPSQDYGRWRDTHLRLEGAAALALQAVFAVDWANATDEELLDARYFPRPAEELRAAALPVQMCLSGPDSRWSAVRQQYFAMIAGARQRVQIATPFFVLDETVAEAIKIAALSGVEVQVMIGAGPGQSRLPGWAANTYAREVAEAGAKVWLYEDGYLHAKTITVDGAVASVGSANWDIRSFSINYELNAVVYDATLARGLEDAFARDLPRCWRFEPGRYRRKPWAVRFRDSVARLASPLL
jgi:cardiolipin synthase